MRILIKYLVSVICMMIGSADIVAVAETVEITKDGFSYKIQPVTYDGRHTAYITGISDEKMAEARETSVLEFPNIVEYDGVEHENVAFWGRIFEGYDMAGIKKFILPKYLMDIYLDNLSNMPDLEEICFEGQSLVCPGNNFINLPKLKSFYFPEYVLIASNCFVNTGIESIRFQPGSRVNFSQDLKFLNGIFCNLPNLEEIELADVDHIEYDTFKDLPKVENLTFNAKLEIIGENGFSDMGNLTKITFKKRDNKFYIHQCCFNNTPKLADIFVENTTPFTLSFEDTDNTAGFYPPRFTLHVPVGSKSLYEEAEVWKDFGKIVEYEVDEAGVQHTVTDSDNWRCSATRGGVTVTGAEGCDVSVITIDGKLIERVIVAPDYLKVDLPAGLYIVSADGRSSKVCVTE